MKRSLSYILLACMMSMLLFGCSNGQTPSQPDDSNPSSNVSSWPGDKAVTIVCPYGAGGGNDTTSRFIAKYLPRYLEGNFVVTNIKGGAGTVGTQSVLDAAADGYTIMFNDTNTDMLYVSGMTDYTIDIWGDFAIPATADATSIQVSKWDTFEQMRAWAAENPGALSIGVEVGSYTESVAAAVLDQFDIDGKIVDIGSTSDQITALAGDQVDMIISPLGNVADYRATGQFKTIAMVLKERHVAVPDVPTLIELGADDWCYMPRYYYLAFKEGTDTAICQKFFEALEQVVADPDFIADMQTMELTPNYMYGDDAQNYFSTTHDIWVKFHECVNNYYNQ